MTFSLSKREEPWQAAEPALILPPPRLRGVGTPHPVTGTAGVHKAPSSSFSRRSEKAPCRSGFYFILFVGSEKEPDLWRRGEINVKAPTGSQRFLFTKDLAFGEGGGGGASAPQQEKPQHRNEE